jgi:hypothetical protein
LSRESRSGYSLFSEMTKICEEVLGNRQFPTLVWVWSRNDEGHSMLNNFQFR